MFDHKVFLSNAPTSPGVYCMKDSHGKVLYVGKAKNLKNRLSSYFQRDIPEIKTQQLVKHIHNIELTVTPSEAEALLLENTLIKSLKPRYNVVFRDDKSYPYLFLSNHSFPRLIYCRGKPKDKGRFFGPYPSALAVKETLNLLQRTFKIRQCDDVFFKARSRPCLQYQIERCSAPCVGFISETEYAEQIKRLKLFLTGKNNALIQSMIDEMHRYSEQLAFEKAAQYRDQIISLRSIFDQQKIYGGHQNVDVCAVVQMQNMACVHFLLIREGRVLASQSFYTKQREHLTLADIIRTFIMQSYLHQTQKNWPNEIVINEPLEDAKLLQDMLSHTSNRTIKLSVPKRGDRYNWLKLALDNAQENLSRKLNQANLYKQRFDALFQLLNIEHENNLFECFDISHTQGVETRASCVVFSDQGPEKKLYRSYNIETATNDDYQSMYEVLTRRYLKMKKNNLALPALVIIDGGKGQLNIARQVFDECQITGVALLAIAKGEKRKPGLETLFYIQANDILTIHLQPHDPALHLLQQIRDEAHRFAISKHRHARAKKSTRSVLDGIPGVGEKRKQNLIAHFGGLQALMQASEDALQSVPGISPALAQKIYQILHTK